LLCAAVIHTVTNTTIFSNSHFAYHRLPSLWRGAAKRPRQSNFNLGQGFFGAARHRLGSLWYVACRQNENCCTIFSFHGNNMKRCTLTFFLILFAGFSPAVFAQATGGRISGVVTDSNGAVVASARVDLLNAQQATLANTTTDGQGAFAFDNVTPGAYQIVATRADFARRSAAVTATAGQTAEVKITLDLAEVSERVTVTAETGRAESVDNVAQSVNVVSEDALVQRATGVLAQAADEEAGLSLQRTSPTIGSIFVRGLVGRSVATYLDGVRVTQSSQRGGISAFFNLTDASNLRAVEVIRGPNSAQYGSDSLGGTISLVTRSPQFGYNQPEWHGQFGTGYTSADNSFGGNALISYGTERFGILANLASRRVNTLRPAGGLDGHAAVTRFLGLPSNVINGNRLPDTAFTQYSGATRIQYAPRNDRQFIFYYQRAQQDGGKRYDQLLGGDGNNIAELRNLMGDFGYFRYLKQNLGWFDNGSFTASFNSQREERVNQGGQGDPRGVITHEYERTATVGFNFFLDKTLPARNSFLFGADVYRDQVRTPAYQLNPVTNVFTLTRPRVPSRARNLSYGAYVQHGWEAIPERLRISSALRYNVASYRARAADSPVVSGRTLWNDDSLRVGDFSGRVGAVAKIYGGFSVAFNYSRGFRTPSITDLGTLGLVGNGFEVDFASAAALGGTIGTTADAAAISTGLPVKQLNSEANNSYDASFRFRKGRVDADLTFFLNDILDTVVTQSLILPAGAVGRQLGGQTISSQSANGVVFVPASTSPVLVRANFGDTRINGIEQTLDIKLSQDWVFAGNFTLIRTYDKRTGLAPNLEGGIPPANVFLRLRYQPHRKRYWAEFYSTLADRQNRLSSLNLADRRTGGTRSRAQIQNFFRRGACVRGLVASGADGRCGTGDETTLLLTGETLAQVQNRILGPANSAPLFPYLPGYGLFNLRGGFRVREGAEITWDFENIGDKSYRGPSWGIDGPGRSLTVRYQFRF
jgi:outer membrane receptor protein involved in Fe transport